MVYNVSLFSFFLFFSSLGNAEQTVGFPCNYFKESRLTIGDLASLSVSDPKRSRSLLLMVFFVKFVFSFGFFFNLVFVIVVSVLPLAKNVAADG